MSELEKILNALYRDGKEWAVRNDAEAERARQQGNMALYFDFARHSDVADACWALGLWEEARKLYIQDAELLLARREWHRIHSGQDYPHDELSDLEAITCIKAGMLDEGRSRLHYAIQYWRTQPDVEHVLTQLGLHAAQVALKELSGFAEAGIEMRQQLPGGRDREARRARQLLHYEPAQVAVLLSDWDMFSAHLGKLADAERSVSQAAESPFPQPLVAALLAVQRGFEGLARLREGVRDKEGTQRHTCLAFEEAMLNFYQFVGAIDWNTYFMRLNTRFAKELALGQDIEPNPFARGKV